MRGTFILIGCVILIVMGGVFMTGLTDFRSREYTDYRDVTTNPGVTTADVTLTLPLLDNEIAWVVLSSNNTDDTPFPISYDEDTRSLSIGGLKEADDRRITIEYRYCQLTGIYYSIADLIARIAPTLFILGIIGLVAVGVYSFWPGRRAPD